MGLSRHSKVVFATSLTVFVLLGPKISSARPLLFSSQVDPQQARQIQTDLFLDLKLNKSRALETILEVNSLTDQHLKDWLQDRVGYVIGENEESLDHLVELAQGYAYEKPGLFPTFEEPNMSQ